MALNVNDRSEFKARQYPILKFTRLRRICKALVQFYVISETRSIAYSFFCKDNVFSRALVIYTFISKLVSAHTTCNGVSQGYRMWNLNFVLIRTVRVLTIITKFTTHFSIFYETIFFIESGYLSLQNLFLKKQLK